MVTILKGHNQLQKVILTYNKLVKIITFMLSGTFSSDDEHVNVNHGKLENEP